MIFRNIEGKLIEINKYDYPNDKIYYEKILNLHKEFTKCDNKSSSTSKNIIVQHLFTLPENNESQINKICKFLNI